MAKEKKEKSSAKEEVEGVDNYEKRLPALLPFASPLAPKKLNKKVLKTVKKGTFCTFDFLGAAFISWRRYSQTPVVTAGIQHTAVQLV